MNTADDSSRAKRLVMLVMALAVLVPSLYGFGTKFFEFIALYRGDVEGAFAISPILNYLLASTRIFVSLRLGGDGRHVSRRGAAQVNDARKRSDGSIARPPGVTTSGRLSFATSRTAAGRSACR